MWETIDSTIGTIDGLAVPIVFDSIGDSFVFTILLIFELALSWMFIYITERNRVLDGEKCLYHLLQRKSIYQYKYFYRLVDSEDYVNLCAYHTRGGKLLIVLSALSMV